MVREREKGWRSVNIKYNYKKIGGKKKKNLKAWKASMFFFFFFFFLKILILS